MENLADVRIALRLINRTLVRVKTRPTDKGWAWETLIGTEPEAAEAGVCGTESEALKAGLEAARQKLH